MESSVADQYLFSLSSYHSEQEYPSLEFLPFSDSKNICGLCSAERSETRTSFGFRELVINDDDQSFAVHLEYFDGKRHGNGGPDDQNKNGLVTEASDRDSTLGSLVVSTDSWVMPEASSDHSRQRVHEELRRLSTKRKYEGGFGANGRNQRRKSKEKEGEQRSGDRHVLYSRVDISTMLEQAILYVKFLQLQIKYLSFDGISLPVPVAFKEPLAEPWGELF
ncbi:transcription factor bHLH139-like [Aristolochia californica]|uniref:transcription factor bHLH139-like n=1 Tax=Aristolochia californica TaxID=171875 RepID=UPI0035E13820